jgi:hypothetical protein
LAAVVAICTNVLASVDCCILKPVSLVELSVQARLILLDEIALAVRFVGANGAGVAVGLGVGVGVGDGAAKVVALAVLE